MADMLGSSSDSSTSGASAAAGGESSASADVSGVSGGASTGAQESATGGGKASSGVGGDNGLAPAQAAYTPNFKYKITGEQDGTLAKMEKDIPEWARPFITSADMEKNVRELFEKADGLDAVKARRDAVMQENMALKEQWGPLVQSAQQAVGFLQKGDLDSFFESVNLTENDIFKYALQRLQLRENPQALQSHEQMRQLQLQNQQLQQQIQQYDTGYTSLAVQQRTTELNTHLSRPDILGAVQSFDARVGRPGAFREEVIKRGKMYAAMNQDIPVEQAISEVVQLIGWQGQHAQAAAPQATPTVQTGEPKPTFPVIKGKGTSPAKKVVKSTDQLRDLARQMS